MEKYFSFHERTKRSEYWSILLSIFLFSFGLGIIVDLLFGGGILLSSRAEIVSRISFLIAILAIWLTLAVTVRRLRDAGINMWFIIFAFIPLINAFAGIYWGCVPSKKLRRKR